MKENNEITALLHLIDDPDEDVYITVSDKIISFGKDIIPNLESLWENTSSEEIQERIELLIHRLHFRDLKDDFTDWASRDADLMEGASTADAGQGGEMIMQSFIPYAAIALHFLIARPLKTKFDNKGVFFEQYQLHSANQNIMKSFLCYSYEIICMLFLLK